jgi:hypothetical protein
VALFPINISLLWPVCSKYPLQRDIFCLAWLGFGLVGSERLALACTRHYVPRTCSRIYSVLKHCAHIRCTHIVCTYSIRSAHVYYIVGVSSMHSSLCSSSMYSYCVSIVHALVTMFLVHVLVTRLRLVSRHYVTMFHVP